VKIGNRISAGCRTVEGLKQGYGLLSASLKIYFRSVLYDRNKKCKSMGLPAGNETVHYLCENDQAIVGQDKDDAEYTTKN
jgi:hypothetical protein